MDSSLFPALANGSAGLGGVGSEDKCSDSFSSEETVVLKFADHSIGIADTLKPLTVKPESKILKNNESIFKQSDFPLALPHMLHGTRKATIETRMALGNGRKVVRVGSAA